jgi:hypothetical protein
MGVLGVWNMAFMEKQEYYGVFYSVETNEGTSFVPADVCGTLDGCEDSVIYYEPEKAVDFDAMDTADKEDAERWDEWCAQLRDYVSGREIREINASVGTLYRLSAPGYIDCTEWTTDADSPELDDDSE